MTKCEFNPFIYRFANPVIGPGRSALFYVDQFIDVPLQSRDICRPFHSAEHAEPLIFLTRSPSMEYDISFLALILVMVLPIKILPWLLIASMAYKGYMQMQEKRATRERERRMAAFAARQAPQPEAQEPQFTPISADQLRNSRLGRH